MRMKIFSIKCKYFHFKNESIIIILENMSQEYDISEYWSQFDEKSRLVAPFYPLHEEEVKSEDPFLDMVDAFLEEEITRPPLCQENPEKTKRMKRKNNIDSHEKILKKMYGVKDRHPMLLSNDDKIIKKRIEEIFDFMRNENT